MSAVHAAPSEVVEMTEAAKSDGKKIVLATGVFDLLHQEHQTFLRNAKVAGDFLVVGLESDKRVREMKGPSRPINTAEKRKTAIEALQVVDSVFILPDDFNRPEMRKQLLLDLMPDILAVSSHSDHLEMKQKMMAEVGGEVQIVHNHNPAISTTILLEKATSSR